MAARFSVSLLALVGSVAAQGFNMTTTSGNATSAATTFMSGTSTSSSASSTATYADGSMTMVGGVKYTIQTDTSYSGTLINMRRRRQDASNSGLQNCLATCSADDSCVGTAYDSTTSMCTYYSSIDSGSEFTDPGTTFATVDSRASSSSTSSRMNGTASATPFGMNNTASTTGGMFPTNNMTMTRSPSSTRTGSSTGTVTSGNAASTPVTTPASLLFIDGVEFLIEINVTYSGIMIEIDIIRARAMETLDDCLVTCADNADCAGTAFNANSSSCTFYSSITPYSKEVLPENTFGTVVFRPTNTTASGSTASNTTAESLICPSYNGDVITSSTTGVAFAINCGELLVGTTFDITTAFSKRQSTFGTGLPTTLSNCVDICGTTTACVGTSYDDATATCTFYSDVRYAVAVADYDSAVRVASAGNDGTTTTVTVGAGAGTATSTVTVTATVFSTTVSTYTPPSTITTTIYPDSTAGAVAGEPITSTITIGSAGETVYPSGAVVTQVISMGMTTYTASPVSTIGAFGGSGSGSTVTITVHDVSTTAVSYCPTDVTFTTIYT